MLTLPVTPKTWFWKIFPHRHKWGVASFTFPFEPGYLLFCKRCNHWGKTLQDPDEAIALRDKLNNKNLSIDSWKGVKPGDLVTVAINGTEELKEGVVLKMYEDKAILNDKEETVCLMEWDTVLEHWGAKKKDTI
jgi:hypothetical protein